ncbi:hypothetical protein AB0I72_15825 [Nocardiopsis sp. NPDC049922]|uniref:hypothetical protein n=1 Tax=Nocardiopsis sp. NPDC049922 TaxID=3155157 RepID=UPI0033D2C460
MTEDHTNGTTSVYHDEPGAEFFELRLTEGEHRGRAFAWGMELPDGGTVVYNILDRSIIRGSLPERTARRLRAELVWL